MTVHTVKLSDLFERIAEEYYDGYVFEQAAAGEDCGDTLALYVVREIRDVASRSKIVLEAANNAIEASISDLTDVQKVITDYIRELDER